MGDSTTFSPGDNLVETLQKLSSENVLIDIILSNNGDPYVLPEVRIISIHNDYITLGPKKPLMETFIPIRYILMYRYSENRYREDEDKIDKIIEETCPTWERWNVLDPKYTEKIDESMIQDDFELPDESIIVFYFVSDDADSITVKNRMMRLSNEFDKAINFMQVNVNEDVKLTEEYGVKNVPTVIISTIYDIYDHISGVYQISFYREKIKEVIKDIKDTTMR